MLSLKIADLYADVRIDRTLWTIGLARIHADIAALRIQPIRFQAVTVDLDAAMGRVASRLASIQRMAAIRITGAGGVGGGGMGGGGGGGRGMMGGGAFAGAAMGLGLPFAASPQMMAGEAVGGLLSSSVRTAIDLQMQFAQLQRITGQAATETERLKAALQAISTVRPGVALSDLITMAQTGARMGIEGTDELTRFVNDLSRVKLVIGDIDTEKLANEVGKVLGVFGHGTEYVAGFGSALSKMGNISKATESDILQITEALSGTARSIGLTLPQIIALSSVLKDVGLSNQLAGSSFSQIFRKMGSESHKVAHVIGMDAKEFADVYRRDPMMALEMVIKKFNEFKDTVSGQEFLSDLGLRGVRTAGSLQQLATQIDLVRGRTKMAAAETGTQAALGVAEKTIGETTGAALGKLGNSFTVLADAIGQPLLGPIKELSGALQGLAGWMTWLSKSRTNLAGALSGKGSSTVDIGGGVGVQLPNKFFQDAMKAQLKSMLTFNTPFGNVTLGGELFGGGAGATGAAPKAAGGGPAAPPGAPPALPAKKPDFVGPPVPPGTGMPNVWNAFQALGKRLGTAAVIADFYKDAAMKRGELALKSLMPDKRSASITAGGAAFAQQRQVDILNQDIEKKQLDAQNKMVTHLEAMLSLWRGAKTNIGAVLRGRE